jgi:biotin transport system substrate-specific component
MSLGKATLIMAPFIPGDLIKAVLAGILTRTIARYRPAALTSRA